MFSGTITALVTPFKQRGGETEIDFDALDGLLTWQLQAGVSGFVVAGTTGECPTLTDAEKTTLLKHVISRVKGQVPVIMGTGVNDTRKTIEATRVARDCGADAALVVTPYYNKPTQEGLVAHFSAVAKDGGLPVVLYNVPSRTAVDISVATYVRLAKVPNIVGTKEATDSMSKLLNLAEAVADKITLLAGDCGITYFVMSVGGKGVISAAANCIPEMMVAVTSNAAKDAWTAASKAQMSAMPYINAIFAETNPCPAKAILKLLGKLPDETLRLPLVSVSDKTRELIKSVFKA